jgi:hypothetical protein
VGRRRRRLARCSRRAFPSGYSSSVLPDRSCDHREYRDDHAVRVVRIDGA